MNARAASIAWLLMTGLVLAAPIQAAAARTASPPGAAVYFHYPLNRVTVPPTFKVLIGLRGMGVAPAGVQKADTGHHHLLIDTPLPSMGDPIPSDPQHIHLGNGQTEVEVTLPPGKHTLQLIVGDYDHVPLDPPVISQRITISVAGSPAQPD